MIGILPRDDDRGVALLEALIAATLCAVLLLVLAALLVGLGRLGALEAADVEVAESVRIARHVLGTELRGLAPADFRAAADSVRLRAPRGLAVACRSTARGALASWEGARAPDPGKDSALVLSPDGAEAVLALVDAGVGAGCGAAKSYALDFGRPLAAGTVLIVFETGVYAAADSALRYRRGAAGRQPLTAVNLLDSVASFRSGTVPLFAARLAAGTRPRADLPPQRVDAVIRVWAEPAPWP